MATGPLRTAWRNYAEMVIPPVTDNETRVMCLMAFYAGAAELFDRIAHATEQGQIDALMNSVDKEIHRFKYDVKKRHRA